MCHISDLFFELIYVRNSWKLAAVTGWITELLPFISVYTKNCSVIQSLNDTDSMNSTLPSAKMPERCLQLSFCIISSLVFFCASPCIENNLYRRVLIISAWRRVRTIDLFVYSFHMIFSLFCYLFWFCFYFCFYFLYMRVENFVVPLLIINFGVLIRQTQKHTTNKFIGWIQNG